MAEETTSELLPWEINVETLASAGRRGGVVASLLASDSRWGWRSGAPVTSNAQPYRAWGGDRTECRACNGDRAE